MAGDDCPMQRRPTPSVEKPTRSSDGLTRSVRALVIWLPRCQGNGARVLSRSDGDGGGDAHKQEEGAQSAVHDGGVAGHQATKSAT